MAPSLCMRLVLYVKSLRRIWSKWQEGLYDNITGVSLDVGLVKQARSEEMKEIKRRPVYRVTDVAECLERTGHFHYSVRWVDINKGDEQSPELRSR